MQSLLSGTLLITIRRNHLLIYDLLFQNWSFYLLADTGTAIINPRVMNRS